MKTKLLRNNRSVLLVFTALMISSTIINAFLVPTIANPYRTPFVSAATRISKLLHPSRSNNRGSCFLYHSRDNGNNENHKGRHQSILQKSHLDYDELPLDFPRREEALVALAAVRRACNMTCTLQPTPSRPDERNAMISTVTKVDLSPVTLADFAAQTMILSDMESAYPHDSFLAEEDSQAALDDDDLLEALKQVTNMSTNEEVLHGLDLGQTFLKLSTTNNEKRVWCLDPIDGTKGFLRGKHEGGQYAVALALIEDGVPTLGILGCPNLPTLSTDENYAWLPDETETTNQSSRGCIFVASSGGGCYQLQLKPGAVQKIHVTDESQIPLNKARFCVGVEKSIADAQGMCPKIAKLIHDSDGTISSSDNNDIKYAIQLDSQAKYAVVARGGAEYYVRLPSPEWVENKWDHAAGKVVLEEAGGKWTDTTGDANIDFGVPGPKISASVRGILGSSGGAYHDQLVLAYAKVQQSANK